MINVRALVALLALSAMTMSVVPLVSAEAGTEGPVEEVAIDLEDRSTKKGTPPQPSEAGDLRLLHAGRDQQGRESPIEATSGAMLTE